MSPIVYFVTKTFLSILKLKIIEIGNKVDVTFGDLLGNAITELESVAIAFGVIVFGAGICLAANGILYMKLYRLLNKTPNNANSADR